MIARMHGSKHASHRKSCSSIFSPSVLARAIAPARHHSPKMNLRGANKHSPCLSARTRASFIPIHSRFFIKAAECHAILFSKHSRACFLVLATTGRELRAVCKCRYFPSLLRPKPIAAWQENGECWIDVHIAEFSVNKLGVLRVHSGILSFGKGGVLQGRRS